MLYAGIDVTPDDVFVRREWAYRDAFEKAGKPHWFSMNFGDEAVWEGSDLIGIIRYHTGDPGEVWATCYRYDEPIACDDDRGRRWYASRESAEYGRQRDDKDDHVTPEEREVLMVMRDLKLMKDEAIERLYAGEPDESE
jgi:hypothetical protein